MCVNVTAIIAGRLARALDTDTMPAVDIPFSTDATKRYNRQVCTPHEWQVFLSGTDEVLAELREILVAGPLRLERALGQYVLRSQELDFLDDPLDVENEARRVLDRAVAVCNLFLNRVGQISIDRLSCEMAGHQHGRGPTLDFVFRVISTESAERVKRDGEELRAGLAADIIHAASMDDRVAEVLSYIGHSDPEWPTIYLIFEAIANDLRASSPGKKAEWDVIASRGWATSADLGRIKQTANAHRHARGFPFPRKPPPLIEAQLLIFSVVRAWLREKRSSA